MDGSSSKTRPSHRSLQIRIPSAPSAFQSDPRNQILRRRQSQSQERRPLPHTQPNQELIECHSYLESFDSAAVYPSGKMEDLVSPLSSNLSAKTPSTRRTILASVPFSTVSPVAPTSNLQSLRYSESGLNYPNLPLKNVAATLEEGASPLSATSDDAYFSDVSSCYSQRSSETSVAGEEIVSRRESKKSAGRNGSDTPLKRTITIGGGPSAETKALSRHVSRRSSRTSKAPNVNKPLPLDPSLRLAPLVIPNKVNKTDEEISDLAQTPPRFRHLNSAVDRLVDLEAWSAPLPTTNGPRQGDDLGVAFTALDSQSSPPSGRRSALLRKSAGVSTRRQATGGVPQTGKNAPQSPTHSMLSGFSESSRGARLGLNIVLQTNGIEAEDAILIENLERRYSHLAKPPPQRLPKSKKQLAREAAELEEARRIPVPADAAEQILLRIMSHLDDLSDLISASTVNRGFYRVFKRNEMNLVKTVTFRLCPAAWQLRELTTSSSQTPTEYLWSHARDAHTTARLRSLILVHCESILRPETLTGLVGADEKRSAEIDTALWQISAFCHVFGSHLDKDVDSQLKWLNGERATISACPTNNVALEKTQAFSKDELHDLDELWACLSVLLQGFLDKTVEARDAGVFENCAIDSEHTETSYLEQWTRYILTHGLSAVVTLSSASFAEAKVCGWTTWTPSTSHDSDCHFFETAVALAYESRMLAEAEARVARIGLPPRAAHRPSRSTGVNTAATEQRTAHAEEVRQQIRRSSATASSAPLSSERRASVFSDLIPVEPQDLPVQHIRESGVQVGRLNMNTIRRKPVQARESISSPSKILFPSLSLHPNASTRLGSSLFPADDSAVSLSEVVVPTFPSRPIAPRRVSMSSFIDPTDKAMATLVVEMGFSTEMATRALAKSDSGQGIDLEKAVEILLGGGQDGPTKEAASPHTPSSAVDIEKSTLRISVPPVSSSPTTARDRELSPYEAQRQVSLAMELSKKPEIENVIRMRRKSHRVLGIDGVPQHNRIKGLGIMSLSGTVKLRKTAPSPTVK